MLILRGVFVLLQGSVQLFIVVSNLTDLFSSTEFDRLTFDWMLSPSLEWTPPEQKTGENGVVTMEARARAFCNEYFYGSNCREFCEPRNNSVDGYYSCDQNGNIVCLEGYMDVSNNCKTRESTTQAKLWFHLQSPKTSHRMYTIRDGIYAWGGKVWGKLKLS